MTKITVIVAAAECSSVQSLALEVDEPFNEIFHVGLPDWCRDFELIAVIQGWPDLKVRDDARTAERGVE